MKKFKILEGKIVKVFKKDGFFRSGKLLEVDNEGICIDDRRDGITFINFSEILEIKEDGRRG